MINYAGLEIDIKDQSVKVDGQVIPFALCSRIYHAYERFCTAEYLMDNYDISEEEAFEKAGEVRELMVEDNLLEEEAVNIVMN